MLPQRWVYEKVWGDFEALATVKQAQTFIRSTKASFLTT